MHFKIHRGTHEIGGSCVEVWTETTRIVIDFGMPLVNPDHTKLDFGESAKLPVDQLITTGILPDIPGLYKSEPGVEITVLLSHAHQDHTGLTGYINNHCKFYMGKATHDLMNITNLFTNGSAELANVVYFTSGVPFTIGNIEIIPYLMDHSAFDAYAFLVRSGGKSLFYSGDFRHHGRKAKAFDWFTHQAMKNVDYLLMEGTTIGRSREPFLTEPEIEERLGSLFQSHNGINLIYTSGQNIDRLVSIYKACRATGKTMVIDFYIGHILTELGGENGIPFPSSRFPELQVFYPYRLSQMMDKKGHSDILNRLARFKITRDEIDANPGNIVMLVRPTMQSDLERYKNIDHGILIYSMWSGYLKDEKTTRFIKYLEGRRFSVHHLHTSGHADLETLQRMVAALQPKNLVPIHTFEGDAYQRIFSNVNVRRVQDKEVVEI